MYDPDSHLAFRSCAVNPDRFDDAFAAKRIETAIALRHSLFDDSTTCYRLVNGEGDGLPGLVCDVYGDFAVVQLDGAGPSNFWHLPGIATLITQCGGPKNIYRKNRSGEPASLASVILGQTPEIETVVKEHGLLFAVNLIQGQKTGFFLDQRDNRERIRRLAKDRRVLNMFGYTGGFSIYAGSGGASHVTTVDSAKPAIAAAQNNWILNGFDASRHDSIAADAFEFLESARSAKKEWDLVIVDPPSFAPGKHHVEKAQAAYLSVLTSALHTTATGGIFAASSCSSHISAEMFLEICEGAVSKAKRRATVLGIYGQPEDHPFPLACQELRYLKFVLLRIE
jgi:23S rRNA (cytosine1962-C5)-methyltransferase